MKIFRFLYILSVGAGMLMAGTWTSCTSMLDEESNTEVPKATYMRNAKEALDVLQGVYANLADDALYGYHLSMLFTISTDIAQCEGSSTTGFREIPTNAHNPSSSAIEETWEALYAAIYDANDFIALGLEKINYFSEADRQVMAIYLAEAKALRALLYFDLVRWYGNVTIQSHPDDAYKAAEDYRQDTPEAVYAFIERDLTEAANVLPWSGGDDPRGTAAFRFSKGAALGLLAKVYATWAGYPIRDQSKWEKAAQTAYEVIRSMNHNLLPNYSTVWDNTCNGQWDPTESLIEVSFYSPNAVTSMTGRVGKWNGVTADAIAGVRGRNAANVRVVFTFLDEWMGRNDPRFAVSVATYKYQGNARVNLSNNANGHGNDPRNWQICTPAKWDTELYVKDKPNYLINNDRSNLNWYILRYSDVLLTYAEAVNEWRGAPTAEAAGALNQVRRRGYGIAAGVNSPSGFDISSDVSYSEFQTLVRKERAYELCFEGHRKHDLIRWGVYVETLRNTAIELLSWYDSANYTVVNNTVQGKHELMPIPRRDLDLMTNYNQNPNW